LLSRIGRLEGIHAGQSCYIFGDGPSIKWFDFHHFTDRPAICCNNMAFHRDFGLLDARYYLMIEPWLFCPRWMQRQPATRDFRLITAALRALMTRRDDVEFFVSLSNWPFVRGENVTFLYRRLPRTARQDVADLHSLRSLGGTFHAALTLAVYMGFTDITLLGFDAWTIQPARNLHWYERGEGEIFEATNVAADFLRTVGKFAEVSTISVDGDSCNVRNIPYELRTGSAPAFHDNHELLSPENMKLLASYPDYRIF
jgi:hypothetical protein